MDAEVKERKSATWAALQSRDTWRVQAQAVQKLHQPRANGRCHCGESVPCRTVQAMREAREELESLEEWREGYN